MKPSTRCASTPIRLAFGVTGSPLVVGIKIGLQDGEECWLASEHGRIPAIAKADVTLKPGVVSMTHGFGWLAGETFDYRDRGSSTSLLISLEKDCEALQAMPRMSGVRVRVEPRT